ncbi:MAG: T9SS type A sorting domain-containing protein [Saprospiraceae bacterium]|nr:T9SS type A sorting domain-containing protein [Saprospiraceae bacterium]
MKIIQVLIIAILTVSSIFTKAQSIERFTLDFGGGTAQSGDLSIHYSIGQPFTNTIDLGEVSISEGFIQGELVAMTTAVDYYPEVTAEIYPNPSFDLLRISSSEFLPNSRLFLLDLNGNILLECTFDKNEDLQIGHLPGGSYILRWVDAQHRVVRQFKVIKF